MPTKKTNSIVIVCCFIGCFFAMVGCQKENSASSSKFASEPGGGAPPGKKHPPCKPTLRLKQIVWEEMGKTPTELWIDEQTPSPIKLTLSQRYLDALAADKLKPHQLPTLVFHHITCNKTALLLQHTVKPLGAINGESTEREEGAEKLPLEVDLTASTTTKLTRVALTAEILTPLSLKSPRDWVHRFEVWLSGSEQKQLFLLQLENRILKIGRSVNVYRHPTKDDARKKRFLPIEIGQDVSYLHFKEAFHARFQRIAQSDGFGYVEITLPKLSPEPSLDCRAATSGDIYYIRPFQKVPVSKQSQASLTYQWKFNASNLGKTALLATDKTVVHIRCRLEKEALIAFDFHPLIHPW